MSVFTLSGVTTDSTTEPSNDPEIAQAGIEFLQRLVGKFPKVLMSHQPVASLEFLFMFVLGALGGTDPLPKAAAAEFWVGHICEEY